MQQIVIPQGEDLTGAVGLVVVRDANARAVLPQTGPAGAQPAGVVTAAPEDGDVDTLVGVTPKGPVDVIAAAPFANGERLTADPDGRVRPAGTGAYVLAHADDEATAPGDVVPAIIVHEGLSGLPVDAAGVPVFTDAGPHSSDGRQIVLPAQFRGDVHVLYAGKADDVVNGTRFAGTAFKLKADAQGEHPLVFGFIEWLYITGGFISWRNAKYGDWIDFSVVAPATAGTPNAGAGAYNITGSKFVPAPLVDGSHDLDLAETLNGNVDFTKVVPVPSVTQAGHFDWDSATEAVTANGSQTGKYDLYDVEVAIRRFCVEVPLTRATGERDLRTGGVKAKRLLPHWEHRAKIYDDAYDASNPLKVSWDFLVGRDRGA